MFVELTNGSTMQLLGSDNNKPGETAAKQKMVRLVWDKCGRRPMRTWSGRLMARLKPPSPGGRRRSGRPCGHCLVLNRCRQDFLPG